ncbi:MAG: VOC family protein [Anaerolineales bacterium]|nr:VOC family protein [Anaerolineales bacterium]
MTRPGGPPALRRPGAQFAGAILYVRDVARSVEFYERAFGLTRRLIQADGTYAELETGAITLAFALADPVPGYWRPAGPVIALTAPDVPAAYVRAVTAGAAEVARPAHQPRGRPAGYVRDLDGMLVEIASPR